MSELIVKPTFGQTAILDRVLNEIVLGKHNRPFFPKRPIDHTQAVLDAFAKTQNILGSVTAAQDIISAACMANGALPYGKRPYSAADPVILLDGEEMGIEAGTYALCALNALTGTTAIPGGYAEITGNLQGDFSREGLEEVLGDCSPGDILLKLIIGEASGRGRAPDRYIDLGLQIISCIGLMVPKPGIKIVPKVKDIHENSGFKLVKILSASGKPLWKKITGETWRDDHLIIFARIAHWWVAFKDAHNIKGSLFQYLRSLPDLEAIKTPYSSTPESNPPWTYNLALAAEVNAAILQAYNLPPTKSEEIVKTLTPHFYPYYDGPIAGVDVIVLGMGEHSNDFLVGQDDNGLWRVPGRLLRQNESICDAAQIAVLEKHGRDATPWILAAVGPQWLKDGTVLRDDRYPTISYVVIAILTTGQSKKVKPKEKFLPLFRKDRSHGTGVSAEVLETEWAYHHAYLLKLAALNLRNLNIVRNDGMDLLPSIISRAPRF